MKHPLRRLVEFDAHHRVAVALRDLEQTASDEITEAKEFKASKGEEPKKE